MQETETAIRLLEAEGYSVFKTESALQKVFNLLEGHGYTVFSAREITDKEELIKKTSMKILKRQHQGTMELVIAPVSL